MILLIKHRVDWELIHHRKNTQINKYNACDNKHRVDYEYKVGDKIMLTNHIAYKYETSYNGPFNDNTLFNNVTVNLQYNMTEIRYIIRRI